MKQSRFPTKMEALYLSFRQRFIYGTAKEACKKASLKKAKIAEAHHGLTIQIASITNRHDKLLSADILCSNLSC